MENASSLPGLVKDLVVFLSGLSILGIVFNQIGTARERQRHEYAKALQTAVKWVEMPYRVHRRKNDDPETKAALAAVFHELQEDFGFYDAWLSVEAPRVAEKYGPLRRKVRSQTEPHIQAAWKEAPAPETTMNLGPRYQVDFAAEQAAFLKAVRLHLAWFGVFEWFLRRWEWFVRKLVSILVFLKLKEPSADSVN